MKNPATTAKIISFISNIALVANLIVGYFGVHWAIIALFFVVHTVLRMQFLKAQTAIELAEVAQSGVEKTATSIAPPVVRNVASVITAVILSVVLYFIGVGVAKLI